MLTVKEAEKNVLNNCRLAPVETKNLAQAFGAILRENIVADRDQPPTHRSTMDGIAIAFGSWKKGTREFQVQGLQKAGIDALTLRKNSNCFEIATGAVLPKGCDCIIPIEEIKIAGKFAFVNEAYQPQRMRFLHLKGTDYKKGQILLRAGTVMNPQQIAVAAAVGKNNVKVTRQPRIAAVGTGDELVAIDKTPKAFQSRRSNVYALEALLTLNGFSAVKRFHINDNARLLQKTLQQLIREYDVIVLSGGVSLGKLDLVPAALKKLGVKVLFHTVSQKPGKPFWFGETRRGTPVFALPGNPVSTQICAYRYVIPYLKKAIGLTPNQAEGVKLTADFDPNTKFTFFLPVKLRHTPKAEWLATPVPYTMSGNFMSLVHSDGFIQLDPGDKPFRRGKMFRLFRWREND